MHAAILVAGVAHLDLRAPFEMAWTVPGEGGQPLRFSHATGNRLVAKRLISRHPLDCRDTLVARYVPCGEVLSDEEIDAEAAREASRQAAMEKDRLKTIKTRAAEGRGRFERRHRPPLVISLEVQEERRKRAVERVRRSRAKKVAVLQAAPVVVKRVAPTKEEMRADSAERMRRSRARKKAARLAEALDSSTPIERPSGEITLSQLAQMAKTRPADKIAFDELWRLMCEAPVPQAEVR
jgi:hypothetical protein